LSVRYREVSGLESADSGSEASVEVGHLPMSTACFEAPTVPSKKNGTDSNSHGDAGIHVDLASCHSCTILPNRGRSVCRKGSLQPSMMPVAFPKVNPNDRIERD
jgi:hypothetical protein